MGSVEQIMFKDKYPTIFWRQMRAIVFIIFQIVFATRAVLKTEECHPDGHFQSRDTFRPIARERKYLMDCKFMYLSQRKKRNQEKERKNGKKQKQRRISKLNAGPRP